MNCGVLLQTFLTKLNSQENVKTSLKSEGGVMAGRRGEHALAIC